MPRDNAEEIDCPHKYWQRGMKQPHDNGMPCSSWGHYLPGDEPGWMCKLTGDGCYPEDCNQNLNKEN